MTSALYHGRKQSVSRVVCVAALFLLCVALGCAAQGNESKGGTAAPVTRPSAVGIDAPNKFIAVKAKLVLFLAWVAVKRIRMRFRQFKTFCDNAKKSVGNSEDAEVGIAEYVNNTKTYLREYTALGVEKSLENLEGNLKTAKILHKNLQSRKIQFCNFAEKFLDKVVILEKLFVTIEKIIEDVKAVFSEDKVAELNRETNNIKTRAINLFWESKEVKTTMDKKLPSVVESGSLAKNLLQAMKNVFVSIQKKYFQCKQAYKQELVANLISQSNGTTNADKLKLRICQKSENQA